jgi:hypothetical protein
LFIDARKMGALIDRIHCSTPVRYLGAAEAGDGGERVEQEMKRLTTTLEAQFAEAAKLEKTSRAISD